MSNVSNLLMRRLPYMLLLTTEESYTLLICALDRGRGCDRALAPNDDD